MDCQCHLVESIEVIRLRTSEGRYITADEDRVSVALSKPGSDVSVPKNNTEWKVVWLEAGKCRLKSIYEKVLAVGDCLLIIQESCPVSRSKIKKNCTVSNGAGDWCLRIKNLSSINAKEFQAALEYVSEIMYLNTTDNGVCLGSTDNWPPYMWTVEVVKSNNYSEQKTNHQQHCLQCAIRKGDQLLLEQCEPQREQERERKWEREQKQERERGWGWAWKWVQQRRQQYLVAEPKSMMPGYYALACLSQSNWPVQQLDHAEQLLNREQELKKSNSTNNISNTPPPLLPPTTSNISDNGGHHQLIQLTGWQVGQVILNYYPPGVGSGYSHYNSGHNVNGFGTQTNGDVNVHTEVGNTRHVSVNFYSSRS